MNHFNRLRAARSFPAILLLSLGLGLGGSPAFAQEGSADPAATTEAQPSPAVIVDPGSVTGANFGNNDTATASSNCSASVTNPPVSNDTMDVSGPTWVWTGGGSFLDDGTADPDPNASGTATVTFANSTSSSTDYSISFTDPGDYVDVLTATATYTETMKTGSNAGQVITVSYSNIPNADGTNDGNPGFPDPDAPVLTSGTPTPPANPAVMSAPHALTPNGATAPQKFNPKKIASAQGTFGLQFTEVDGHFPKCQNESIGPQDYTLITSPLGHEKEVDIFNLFTTPAGSHTAVAKWKGQRASIIYSVLPGGTDIAGDGTQFINGSPFPTAPNSPGTSTQPYTKVSQGEEWGMGIGFYYYKTTIVYHAVPVWTVQKPTYPNQSAGANPTVKRSIEWSVDGTVGGEGDVGVPGLAGAKIHIDISLGWKNDTGTDFPLHAGPAPYLYDLAAWQEVASVGRDMYSWKNQGGMFAPDTTAPWVPQYIPGGYLNIQAGNFGMSTQMTQTTVKHCPI